MRNETKNHVFDKNTEKTKSSDISRKVNKLKTKTLLNERAILYVKRSILKGKSEMNGKPTVS